jgi:hypothetical protein
MYKGSLSLVDEPKERQKKLITDCEKQSLYTFRSNELNPEYYKGLITIPNKRLIRNNEKSEAFESCHIRNNAEKNESSFSLIIKTTNKWNTYLSRIDYNPETGEVDDPVRYCTNELKRANARKIKALNKFCKRYQPMYKRKDVTLFFITLTSMDKARLTIRELIDILKYRIKVGLDREILSYIWTLEVSKNIHCHYHLCIAVKRVDMKGKKFSDYVKLETVWGCRSQFDFVKKDIKRYLSKYFAKDQSRVLNHRSYGISRTLKTP